MTRSNIQLLSNIVLFQCAWFSLVLGYTVLGLVVTTTLLLHTFLTSRDRQKEMTFCLMVVVFGVLADSILMQFGVYLFTSSLDLDVSEQLIPIWLISLWVAFSLTLNRSLNWLVNIPWLLVILLAVFGPLSYYAGTQLNPELIQMDQTFVWASAIQWALMGLVIFGLYLYLLKDSTQITGERHA